MKQLDLINSSINEVNTSEFLESDSYLSTISKAGFKIIEVDAGDITFLGGQNESVHRWFRLTPSYSPSLVRFFLEKFEVNKSETILDPFSGRGTTVIECQKRGYQAVSVELNPLFKIVGEYSLIYNNDNIELFDNYLILLKDVLEKNRDKDLETILDEYKLEVPDIHDVFRWWKKDVLKDLLLAKYIAEYSQFSKIKCYLWLALNMSSLECANIHRNHPTISFDDNHNREINVFDDLQNRINNIYQDLLSEEIDTWKTVNNKVILGNSIEIEEIFAKYDYKSKFNVVITSPPYPNRFSYIHQTRPQLHFMDVIKDRKEATELDLKAIGGTWGRATSILMKELIEVPDHLKDILSYYAELSGKSTLMCNYATKYFIDIDKHIKGLKNVLAKDARGTYVVGNSRLSGVEIHTEIILAKILEQHGLRVTEILVFRKRGGRKKLYETAVCFTN